MFLGAKPRPTAPCRSKCRQSCKLCSLARIEFRGRACRGAFAKYRTSSQGVAFGAIRTFTEASVAATCALHERNRARRIRCCVCCCCCLLLLLLLLMCLLLLLLLLLLVLLLLSLFCCFYCCCGRLRRRSCCFVLFVVFLLMLLWFHPIFGLLLIRTVCKLVGQMNGRYRILPSFRIICCSGHGAGPRQALASATGRAC